MNDSISIAMYAFQRFGDTVMRTAFTCCDNYAEAEDITQEVFLALHADPRSFTNDEHLKAWLIRCTINKCRNYRKSGRVRLTMPIDEIYDSIADCGPPGSGNIIECISSLPDKYSSVVYLHYYEGYTIHEIAEMTGKSPNTIGSLLRRGREKLKLELEKEDDYEA